MYACHCFVGYLEWVGVGEVRARTSCEEVQESGVEVSIYPTSLRCHDESVYILVGECMMDMDDL